MDVRFSEENLLLDVLDRAIVHGIQCHPRVSFSRLAAELDVSEQTVARRYRRMRSEGFLRVVGVVNPRGLVQSSWMVRIACRPDGAVALAAALARRDDVGWVSVASGGAEVVAALWARTDDDRDDLLLQRLPAQAPVLGMTMHAVLRHFRQAAGSDWTVPTDAFSLEQTRQLFAERPDLRIDRPDPPEVEDAALIAAMAVDGRASISTLATATGWSEGRVARRLERLFQSGVLYLDVDVLSAAVGLLATAGLWLTVEPRYLDAAGRALVEHPQVAFVAALSGPSNLTASVLGADFGALYDLVTTAVASIDGVRGFELSPALRIVKQAGSLIDRGRLVSATRT